MTNISMSNEVFDVQTLTENLKRLNNSQQSIETLSQWCVFHRKKARQIVEIWYKLFIASQKEQRVSFLYLANDILQNSRRKGSEFVNEFWKVLPAALKSVYENGEEYGKKAVARLVEIWDERKVFGSRGQGLKDDVMGNNPTPLPANNGKSSNPIKIVKRDSQSLRIKLAVGGFLEKILTAFHSVLDEHLNEETTLGKCCAAVCQMGKIVEDVENNLAQGNSVVSMGSTLDNELQEQEKELFYCIKQLEKLEGTRALLISQLKEALFEQVSRQELIHIQLQAARGQIEQVGNMRRSLMSALVPGTPRSNGNQTTEVARVVGHNLPAVQINSPSLSQPVVSFAPLKPTEEDKKAAAAAVVAKLAASTSSAQMLTSVLSSFVAEETASMNGNLTSAGYSSGRNSFPPEKRPKLEKPMAVSDVIDSDLGTPSHYRSLQQTTRASVTAASPGVQPTVQGNQMQVAFTSQPPLHSSATSTNQYAQSAGLMMGSIPCGYVASSLPPPPPLPPHVAMGISRSNPQTPQQPQAQPSLQLQPASIGFYRPPGVGFYGPSRPSTPPPVPRQ